MNVKDIEARVAQIAGHAHEPDATAHELEDALFLDVLKAIAAGVTKPAALAAAAIKSADLDIKRWYE